MVELWLRLTRVATNQWWIGRDRRDSEGYLRGGFPINERAERVSDHTAMFAKVSAGFFIERPLDYMTFRRLVHGLPVATEPPLYMETLHDAIYFSVRCDNRRAILEAAIAAEASISWHVQRLVDSGSLDAAVAQEIEKRDFLKRFGEGMKRALGASFHDDDAASAEWLRRLWIARGHVAHAKDPVVVADGVVRPVEQKDVTAMIKALLALTRWLASIVGHRSAP